MPGFLERSTRWKLACIERLTHSQETLTRNRPPFRDERQAPKIDPTLLLVLMHQELPERTARDVYRFIISFKSWSEAYCDLLVREYRARHGGSLDSR